MAVLVVGGARCMLSAGPVLHGGSHAHGVGSALTYLSHIHTRTASLLITHMSLCMVGCHTLCSPCIKPATRPKNWRVALPPGVMRSMCHGHGERITIVLIAAFVTQIA